MKRHFVSHRPHFLAGVTPSFAAAAFGIFCAAMFARTGQAESWAQSYGARSYDQNGAPIASANVGSGYDVTRGIARMPDGGFVVSGQLELPQVYRNVENAGSGNWKNGALIRYAPDGTILWHQLIRQDNDYTFPNGTYQPAPTFVYTVLTDAQGNIFICGGKGSPFTGAIIPFVAKFDPNGTLIWQNGISEGLGNGVTPTAALTRDGGVLVTMAQGGNGTLDPALAKLNSDGSLAFYAVYDQASQYRITSAVCESATENNVFVAVVGDIGGLSLLRIDGSGNLLGIRHTRDEQPSRPEEPVAMVPTPDGGYATLSRAGTYFGVVLRKFDQNLVPIFEKWIRPLNNPNGTLRFAFVGDNLVAEPDGGLLVGGAGGSFAGGVEPFPGGGGYEAAIMRISPTGDVQFVSVLGGPHNEGGVGERQPLLTYVVRAADGGYALTASSFTYRADTVLGKTDWWTVKTDANRRVANFAGLMSDLPLYFFTSTNVPNTATSTPTFERVAASISTSTAPNFIFEDLATKTGINKPDVIFQGSSLPRIVSSNTAEAIVGQHFSYHTDLDFVAPGATLTYSATGLPDNFRINTRTGVISGAPRPGSATTEPIAITLQVSDGTNTIQFVLHLTISLGPPRFSVNGRNEPVYPGSAPPVTGLADQPLRFSANYGGRQAGQFVGVQVSTNPADPASWQPLGNATEGFMIYDSTSDSYVVNSTAYPQAAAVYFRTNVKTAGRADAASNVVGPFNLSSTAQRVDKTSLYITRNGPVANIRFGVTQLTPPPDVSVRLQSTTTPSSESTWTTVSFLTVDPNDARQFYLDRDDYPVGDGVYFRVIATAPGYVQSLSSPQGPFTFIHDPAAQVTITIPDSGGSGGTSFDNPLTPSASSFLVGANATGAGRILRSLNLLYDGDRIDRFIGGTTNGSTQFNTGVAGHHLIEAVAIDDLGVQGHARPVHVHVRPSGGKIFRRTDSGIWADPAAWVDEAGTNGIPGENDFAVLSGFDVSVASPVTVRAFSLNGGKMTGAGKVTVTGMATLGRGTIRNDMDIAQGATLLLINDENVQLGGTVVNRGRTKFHGKGGIIGVQDANPRPADGDTMSPEFLGGIKAFFVNLGKALFHPPAGGRGQTAPPPRAPEVRPIVFQQLQNQGEIKSIAADGAPIISNDGASAVARNASGLVDRRGNRIISGGAGNIVAGGAGNIISNDGASIISNDGASVVAIGRANIISNDGASIISGGAGNRPSSTDGSDGTTPPAGFVQTAGEINLTGLSITSTMQLNGGLLTGSGAIVGDVTNDGALIAPGNSPGSLAVTGSFSQNIGGTLRIEAAGGEAHQFDQLQVGGTAALGGTLDLRMIGGYVPLPDDAFVPLGYAAVTGAFHTVSSNAQVSVTPTGIVTVLDPAAAPPFALLSAVSRKTHGNAGIFDANLPVSGSIGVEPRRSNPNGEHQLVLTFSEAVNVGGVAITGGNGTVSSATLNEAELTVNLTGVTDQQILTINAANVNNGTTSISPSLSVGFLVGDTNGDRVVNGGDAIQTRSRSGQAVDGTNFRSDVNTDGNINGGDSIIVRGRSGSSVTATAAADRQ
jgi:hypothetical protein